MAERQRTPSRVGILGKAAQWSEQGLAGARGAQDAFTFGLGDRANAGLHSLIEASRGNSFNAAYEQQMSIERARDAYDAKHYAIARTIGQVLGTGAQIAASGPLAGAALAGVRAATGGVRMAQRAGPENLDRGLSGVSA